MKIKKLLFLATIAFALTTLMSTTCKKDDPTGSSCTAATSATATGEINQSFCFDNVTSYNYDPANYISFMARETSTGYSLDFSVSSVNGQPISTGTYQCGLGDPGFVELITADDEEFYKSQSGTLTISSAGETGISGSFNIAAIGFYNEKTINLSGNFSN